MSDPKRATLITVGAPKSAKANVNKTVRLTINLDESNESKYPELNYKELVIAEERKKRVQNGKTAGLDPFSDNDDDVERVARKFEQKYGGKSTYGKRKRRSKQDDFADIGAGYDENDSFIDNTHGYDEMIPPECDTFHGGFYINCGSLEFKTVPQEQSANSDEPPGRRNKRRISSSSSEDDSSESSSESESQDADDKHSKAVANGDVDSHKTEHRKKKNKKIDKQKAKKVRRTNSSAATSGKQTSDENNHADAESADCLDSRTSQSDSLTSKPAPSSENPITSDSSRDVEAKVESKLPEAVEQALEALEASVAKQLIEHPSTTAKQLLASNEHLLLRLEACVGARALEAGAARAAWARAAAACRAPRARHVLQRARRAALDKESSAAPTTTLAQPSAIETTASTATTTTNNKRKHDEDDNFDVTQLTEEQREAKIVETLQRLKALIEERKPSMLANYNAECERVQEERKKLQIAQVVAGAPHVEKRLPKRRFPWCGRARSLLARLTRLAPGTREAALLLAERALPLFPNGFVRMPTLLRQADLSKEIKISDVKRQRLGSASHLATTNTIINSLPPAAANVPFTEPIQFPSSLTVTTSLKQSPEKNEIQEVPEEKYKSNSIFGSIMNSFSLSKDLIVEKEKKDDNKEELYVPPNNIGSITITPVTTQPKEKKSVIVSDKPSSGGLIRVKSPAALNDMVNKKDLKIIKKQEKTNSKDKRVESPLHIDTSFQPSKIDPSPKSSETNQTSKKDPSPKGKDEITQKQIETMRVAEDKIPRPALVPVHHSPTFAKPDKRPPEGKKKKDIIVVSDLDPLSDLSEPLNIDDSSSDVEVIETTDKSDSSVPSKDKTSSVKSVPKVKDGQVVDEDASHAEIDTLMRNLREMEHSQETTKFNSSNSYGGVITSAKRELSAAGRYPRGAVYGDARTGKDKLAERTSMNKMDGINPITG